MVAQVLLGLGGGGWGNGPQTHTLCTAVTFLCFTPTPHSVTSHHCQEVLTLKAFLYGECSSLLSKFCFAQDQWCVLHTASKFLRTNIHLMDQMLKQREKRSPSVCIG